MNIKKLHRWAMITSAVSLAIFLAVILSGTAYPHPVFQIGVCAGLVFVVLSLSLMLIGWFGEIYRGLREKQYLWVVALVVLGLIVIGTVAIRSFS